MAIDRRRFLNGVLVGSTVTTSPWVFQTGAQAAGRGEGWRSLLADGRHLDFNRDIGLTVILVEQNVSFVRRAARRLAMMEKGRAFVSGDIENLSNALVHRHMAV